MNDKEQSLSKLTILDVIYCQLIKKEISASLQYLIGAFLKHDDYFSQLSLSSQSFLNQMTQWAFDVFFICKYSCTPNEFLFNFIKIDKATSSLLSSQSFTKLIVYCMVQFIDRLLTPLILSNSKRTSLFSYLRKGANVLLQMFFVLRRGFSYSNWIDFLFNVVTINKGNDANGFRVQQLVFFGLYLLMKYSEHSYAEQNRLVLRKDLTPPKKLSELTEGKCPLCNSMHSPPRMALRCCGAVFCVNCIERYAKLNDKCFICKCHLHKSSLVRLYDGGAL